jgi:hypothetical protein
VIFGSTRVDVLRSTDTEDGRGDPVESDDVALADLPVDIAEGTKRRRNPADGQMVTLSGFNVAVRASCPFEFKATDRLRDRHTGVVLQVETITNTRGFAGRRRVLFCTESG